MTSPVSPRLRLSACDGPGWVRWRFSVGQSAHCGSDSLRALWFPSFPEDRGGLEIVPLRLLLVDDDDGIHRLLEVAFAADARFVLAGRARNGAEGVAFAQSLRPDVILMDLHMPVMDGAAATAAIIAADASACVICFTSSTDRREHEAIRHAGATAILRKPFDPELLLDAVAEHGKACAA